MNQSLTPSINAVMPAVKASGLLTSLCTITVPPDSTTYTASGAPDPAIPYTPLAGHQNIPCSAPPLKMGESVQPTEVKEVKEIMARTMLDVFLGGYFPAIVADYRALIGQNDGAGNLVNGVEFDILGVVSDSQKTQTVLAVQLATI